MYFLIFTLVLLLGFIVSKPSRQKAINDLKMNSKEIELIRNDASIIHRVQSQY